MFENEKILGLKIDVDTYRGTKYGVPSLLETLAKYDIKGSFFFSIGPDNMGRHAWRLLKPKFLKKMLRGNAAKLYGFDIIFKGLLCPGPDIGKKLPDIMKNAEERGHEVALHAYDHYKWQMKISKASLKTASSLQNMAIKRWNEIFSSSPKAAGTPGWQLSQPWLDFSENNNNLFYRSDSRGNDYGFPVFNGKQYTTLQIPTTLPTYDETIGKDGINNTNYNEFLLSKIQKNKLNVVSIHAEVEGIACKEMFKDFIVKALQENIKIVPLIQIYEMVKNKPQTQELRIEEIPGREGKLAVLGKILC